MNDDEDFALFVKKIRDFTTIDLNQYKEAQMRRRLTTLRTKKGFSTFAAFFEAIAKEKNLLYEFLDRMTINVSEFWRNANRWEILEKKFIPEMLQQNCKIKCWSAACSTGEEPYTLAMIIAEARGGLQDIQISATDIDEGALEKARNGMYLDRSIRDIPATYLKKYFKQNEIMYEVTADLKTAVNFQKHNLLLDHFEANHDLIVCRNVIIYFTEEAKHLLYQKFAQALKPGGILFVGSTEQIFTPGQYRLEPVETFYYRKK
jgi:chemotaxis protein methyltransferase CheR